MATPGLAPAGSAPLTSARPRLDSVDLLRGLVMVLMALDHTRGYFSNVMFYPLDLEKTNVALFLTRWITHYCAPVFVFLAGTGAFLSARRGKTTGQLSWFLFSRGLWLVFLEITVIRWFGWSFSFDMHFIGVGVIWAIGCSMVVLAGLVFLPTWAITAFGVVMIVGHNALDGIKPESWGAWHWLWRILHTGGGFEWMPGYRFGAGYPLIPWIGVMAAGYGLGTVMLQETSQRRRWLLGLGIALTVLFVILRGSNVYGDPGKWLPQKNTLFTAFAWLHCNKYPPSLCYLLMTLGPALIALAIFDRGTPRFMKPLLVFGRVPLFYYVLHLTLIHALAIVAKKIFLGPQPPPSAIPNTPSLPYGFDLPGVYLAWITVVVILYPACRWFAEVKRTRRGAWLSYL